MHHRGTQLCNPTDIPCSIQTKTEGVAHKQINQSQITIEIEVGFASLMQMELNMKGIGFIKYCKKN